MREYAAGLLHTHTYTQPVVNKLHSQGRKALADSGDENPEFGVGVANASCPSQKYLSEYTKKDTISREKFKHSNVFRGEGQPSPQAPPPVGEVPLPHTQPFGPKKEEDYRMWANAQRDGRPAKYRWRPLFNAAKFG